MEGVTKRMECNKILEQYKRLYKVVASSKPTETNRLRKSFRFMLKKLKNLADTTVTDDIIYDLAVTTSLVKDLNLGQPVVDCALFYSISRKMDLLPELEDEIGKEKTSIVSKLIQIEKLPTHITSPINGSHKFQTLIQKLFEDGRIMIIKLVQCVHSMRRIESFSKTEQHLMIDRTENVYTPLAHQIGIHGIKKELEDLCMKFRNPQEYHHLQEKIKGDESIQERLLQTLKETISRKLTDADQVFKIKTRYKGIYSMWRKISKQDIAFEDLYDRFGLRIILDVPVEKEKIACWETYKIVTDLFPANPDKARNWLENPKKNGYQSLHVVVMSKEGKWVEIQIRTRRMDEFAERGDAAHWVYKESAMTIGTNEILFLDHIRKQLLTFAMEE